MIKKMQRSRPVYTGSIEVWYMDINIDCKYRNIVIEMNKPGCQ